MPHYVSSPPSSATTRSQRLRLFFNRFHRGWAMALTCLLLLAISGVAQEFTAVSTDDIRGTPATVSLNYSARRVKRSQRKVVRRQRAYRSHKVAARQVEHRRLRTLRPLRRRSTRLASGPRRRGNGGRTKPRTTPQTRPNKPQIAQAPRGNKPGAKPGQKPGARKPPASTSGNKGAVLAQAPPEEQAPADDTEDTGAAQDVAGAEEEVHQNLTLSFVTPRRAPAVGVKLIAHVTPAEGEAVTYDDLTTNARGQVKLENIALPATVDFDFPGEASAPAGAAATDAADDAATDATLDGAVADKAEWAFADSRMATLLLENPVGTARVALVPTRARLASLKLPSQTRLAAAQQVQLYEGEQPPIVLERQVVDLDISAPAGSVLSSPALGGKPVAVPATGRLALRLPLSALEEGAVPIRVAQELPGGEAEAVIDAYKSDPYEANAVQSPALRLARLARVERPSNLGVMASRADVAQRLGDLKGKGNKNSQLGKVTPLPDGSEWWIYPAQGAAFKLRAVPGSKPRDKNAGALVERVRLFNARGGSLGGIAVGASLDDMRAHLSAPQVENDARTPSDALSAPGQIDTWLDGGLRVCHDATKVLWMETVRPDTLLLQGTTAFVPRAKARLFIEGFEGHPKTNLVSVEDLGKYLEQVHSVVLVPTRSEADLVLRARVAEFKEDKDSVGGLIPYRYDCSTRLQYSIFNTIDNKFAVQNKMATGTAQVNMTKEAAAVGIGAGVLAAKGGRTGKILGALLVGGGIVELNRVMQKAANRCPAISSRTAFNQMVSDINRASDFSLRVTAIDYSTGMLRLNAGRAEGISAGAGGSPDDFQISIANQALPQTEEGRSSDFYAARVVSVDEHSSVCRLMHVNRTVKKLKEGFKEEPAPDVARQLPEAATGLISARSWVQFPDVTVISDADIQRAQATLDAQGQGGQAQEQQQEPQQPEEQGDDGGANTTDDNTNGIQDTGRKKAGLGGVLGGILGRKKK